MKLLTVLLLAGAVGCATEDGSAPDDRPRQHMPGSTDASFTLYVSNQSLDQSLVDIQVYVDGELAVSGEFNTFSSSEGGCGGEPLAQHNWHEFRLDLAPGPHAISVVSADSPATLDATVTIDPRQFGVLDFWYDATTDEPAHFQFFATAEQPAFL